jgi:hypothetical protein
VRAPAVGLDDQLAVGPEEVDLAAQHDRVTDRARQLGLSERGAQRALELASGWLGVIVGAARDQPEHPRLRPGPVTLAAVELRDRLQRGHRWQALVRTCLDRSGVDEPAQAASAVCDR